MISTCWRRPLPEPARLGFDSGWLVLQPSFLNFGLRAVLIDKRLITAGALGLEAFANRDPRAPWRQANVQLLCSGTGVALWRQSPPGPIAVGPRLTAAADLAGHDQIILLVGNTYDVQLSWSALWTCDIGQCGVEIGNQLPVPQTG